MAARKENSLAVEQKGSDEETSLPFFSALPTSKTGSTQIRNDPSAAIDSRVTGSFLTHAPTAARLHATPRLAALESAPPGSFRYEPDFLEPGQCHLNLVVATTNSDAK